jgi:hypothetical protein
LHSSGAGVADPDQDASYVAEALAGQPTARERRQSRLQVRAEARALRPLVGSNAPISKPESHIPSDDAEPGILFGLTPACIAARAAPATEWR